VVRIRSVLRFMSGISLQNHAGILAARLARILRAFRARRKTADLLP
jgi:hypothetical protein